MRARFSVVTSLMPSLSEPNAQLTISRASSRTTMRPLFAGTKTSEKPWTGVFILAVLTQMPTKPAM